MSGGTGGGAASGSGSGSVTTAVVTPGGSGNQACAACKFQRRRCSAECPLARYFPAEHNQRFMNCKRLFGVSNMVRFLKEVDPSERDDTMKSLIFEADQRERDPVHGCLGIICRLKEQQSKLAQDLASTRDQLAFLQQEQDHQNHHRHPLAAAAAAAAYVPYMVAPPPSSDIPAGLDIPQAPAPGCGHIPGIPSIPYHDAGRALLDPYMRAAPPYEQRMLQFRDMQFGGGSVGGHDLRDESAFIHKGGVVVYPRYHEGSDVDADIDGDDDEGDDHDHGTVDHRSVVT